MAKNVISSSNEEEPSVATTQQEQDGAATKAEAARIEAKAKELEVKLSSDPEACEIGKKYYFFNTSKWTIRCPYSAAMFPADNLTPSKVVLNEWIHSQIAAGILQYQS